MDDKWVRDWMCEAVDSLEGIVPSRPLNSMLELTCEYAHDPDGKGQIGALTRAPKIQKLLATGSSHEGGKKTPTGSAHHGAGTPPGSAHHGAGGTVPAGTVPAGTVPAGKRKPVKPRAAGPPAGLVADSKEGLAAKAVCQGVLDGGLGAAKAVGVGEIMGERRRKPPGVLVGQHPRMLPPPGPPPGKAPLRPAFPMCGGHITALASEALASEALASEALASEALASEERCHPPVLLPPTTGGVRSAPYVRAEEKPLPVHASGACVARGSLVRGGVDRQGPHLGGVDRQGPAGQNQADARRGPIQARSRGEAGAARVGVFQAGKYLYDVSNAMRSMSNAMRFFANPSSRGQAKRSVVE